MSQKGETEVTFGRFLRGLREDRKMTLRQLGQATNQDYVLLNKIELGLRMPPPLEAIIALADALHAVEPLAKGEFERLLDLAAQPNKDASARFTGEEVARLKASQTAGVFFTRREKGDKGND